MKLSKIRPYVLSGFHKIFSMFGRKARFFHALRLVRLFEPLIDRLAPYSMPGIVLGTRREFTTATVLISMTLHDVEFDPEVSLTGDDLNFTGGAILITGHFYLNFVFLRKLHDIGRQPATFLDVSKDQWRLLGTNLPLEVIEPNKMSLVHLKRCLSEGKLVTVAIDNSTQLPNYKKLNVATRDVFVSDTIIKFALRSKIPIYFFDTFFDENNNIVAEIVKVNSKKTALVLDEFSQFISAALERRKQKL